MQRFLMGATCALLLIGGPASTRGQTITTGVLQGVVRADSLDPLGDVAVTLTANEGGAVRSFTTSRTGEFRFSLLAPGIYTVLIERLGYRPKRFEQVQVRSGDVRLQVNLTPAPPPVGAPEVVVFHGEQGGTRAGVSQWLSAVQVDNVPFLRREIDDVAGLSTNATSTMEVEGLPSWMSTYYIDGVTYTPARHPGFARDGLHGIGLPLNSIQSAELVTGDADLEWSGFAGGALAIQSRRGSAHFSARTFGSWSGGPLQSSKFFDAGDVAGSSLWGGMVLSGPVIRDTAHYVIGVEARQVDLALPRPWDLDETVGSAVMNVARDSFGIELQDFSRPFAIRTQTISAFGRFDWQLGNDNSVSVRFNAGNIGEPTTATGIPAAAAPSALAQGKDFLISATLASRIRTDWEHEIRIGFGRSTRDFATDLFDAATAAVPPTSIVAGANRFGVDPRLPARFQRSDLTTAQSLIIPRNTHRLKLGLETVNTSHQDDYAFAHQGLFVFGGPAEFALNRGSFVQSVDEPRAKFSANRIGAFFQDSWQAAPDLQVVAGVRYDFQSIPRDKIEFNQTWFNYTGIFNDSIVKRVGALSPRLGLTWNVSNQGLWIVRADAGLYTEDIDPTVIGAIITQDGDLHVRRVAGNLGPYPIIAGPQSQVQANPALALLGPNYRAPLSSRASLGVSHRVGSATVHVSGAYRSTDFITRHADLNLSRTPSAQDQNGRSVFGTLVQTGQLVAGRPNRRFSDFDEVSALNSDGWSRYWGVTAGVEKTLNQRVGFFASYTYSHTTDNWLGAGTGIVSSQFTPFPDATGDAWREGTSDFDLPHRATAGIDLRTSGSLQPHVTALYRFRSGYPFTPGFRSGVDVNGDGSADNDPAYVDGSVAGITDLTRTWSCLSAQVGRFADRNACRSPNVHSLDVRGGLTLASSSALSAELYAEGINLIESEQAEPDRALYLIDASRQVTQNGGTVTLPLIVNPHFGQPLTRFGSGRVLRIGIQVNY